MILIRKVALYLNQFSKIVTNTSQIDICDICARNQKERQVNDGYMVYTVIYVILYFGLYLQLFNS